MFTVLYNYYYITRMCATEFTDIIDNLNVIMSVIIENLKKLHSRKITCSLRKRQTLIIL